MINIKELTVKFGNNTILDNISIDFLPSRIHGIIGLNGAGKTTFFNVLSNIIRGDTGKFTYNNRSLTKQDIGYMETVNFFYSRITGNEYLKIFKQTNSNFDLLALQFFLKLPLDELIENYSTGMKKKLALLGTLKQGKEIYLLDEPFNGLDIETNKILELIILALKEKKNTVFVSSHIISPLLTVCDEIHFIENGRFKKTYSKNEFSKIEDELLGEFQKQVKNIITNAV